MNNISAGKLFKELRTKQNISLKEAVKDIDKFSTSRLSHWEKDSSNIPLYKLDQLLYNIHVLPTEFAELLGLRFVNTVTLKVQDAFIANNINELYRLASKQLAKYNKIKDDNELYLSAVSCNFYFQKSQINIFPTELKVRLTNSLENISLWNQYYITILGNAVNLVDSKQLFKIAKSLIKNMDHIKKSGLESYIYATLALLNVNTKLLFDSPQLAKKLFVEIDKLEINQFDFYSSLYKKFIYHLISYKTNKTNIDLKLAQNLVDLTYHIDKPEAADELNDILLQIQNSSK